MDIQYFNEVVKDLKSRQKIKSIKDLAEKMGAGYTYLSELNSGSKPTTKEIIGRINSHFKTKYVFKPPDEAKQIAFCDYLNSFGS